MSLRWRLQSHVTAMSCSAADLHVAYPLGADKGSIIRPRFLLHLVDNRTVRYHPIEADLWAT